jgi:hypothetical protein
MHILALFRGTIHDATYAVTARTEASTTDKEQTHRVSADAGQASARQTLSCAG